MLSTQDFPPDFAFYKNNGMQGLNNSGAQC